MRPYFQFFHYGLRRKVSIAHAAPTKLEMLEAIGKLHDSAPGASGLRASAWKALAGYGSSSDAIFGFISFFWNSGQLTYEFWAVGLLSILPKKSDLSLPGNYWGITMIEVAYKVVAQILLARLKVKLIKESKEHLTMRISAVSGTDEGDVLGRIFHDQGIDYQKTRAQSRDTSPLFGPCQHL